MKIHSNTKVRVSYPNGKNEHLTTIGRLKRRLSIHGYSQEKIDGIIEALRSTGYAASSIADYEIVRSKWETT